MPGAAHDSSMDPGKRASPGPSRKRPLALMAQKEVIIGVR